MIPMPDELVARRSECEVRRNLNENNIISSMEPLGRPASRGRVDSLACAMSTGI